MLIKVVNGTKESVRSGCTGWELEHAENGTLVTLLFGHTMEVVLTRGQKIFVEDESTGATIESIECKEQKNAV